MQSSPSPRPTQIQPQVISNILTLDVLVTDPDFREFWHSTLAGMRKFGMNEAILAYMHSAKVRKGTIDAINAQAALDMHRLEGSLEIWEVLLNLLSEKVQAPLPNENEDDTTL